MTDSSHPDARDPGTSAPDAGTPPPHGGGMETRTPTPFAVLGELDGLLADATQPHDHVEQALALVEEGIRTYLDAVGVIIVALDRAGRILFLNRRGRELLGCVSDCEILGMDWFEEFVPARRHAADRAVLERVWSSEDGFDTLEGVVVTRDGEERLLRWTLDVLRDSSGAVWAAVGTGHDITDQRHSEDELVRIVTAVESAHDGIGIMEPDGTVIY